MASSTDSKVTPYDFKHPNHIHAEQKSALSLIFSAFAENASSRLYILMKDEVSVTFEGLHQGSFNEFIQATKTPAALATVDMPPLNGFSVLSLQGPVAFTMVNRMLGGDGNIETPERGFTSLEMATLRKSFNALLSELQMSWSSILKVNFTLYETESNPAFVRSISLRENCLTAAFTVKVGDVSGKLTICLPISSLEPILSKLGNQQWQRYSGKVLQEIEEKHKENFRSMKVTLKAILGHANLSMAELLALEVDDILCLDQRAKEPITIYVEETPKFKGHIGLVDKFRGVSIQQELFKE